MDDQNKPNQPAPEPEQPAEPAAPAAPAEPAEPASAAEPVPAPVPASQPVMPQQPIMPSQPADASEPFQPQQPAMPQQPPASPAPTQPTQAYGQPSPGYPQQPGQQPTGYGQPPVPGYGQPQPPYQPTQASSGKAIGALVCGILAIVLSGFPIVGIVLGIVAIVLASKAVKEAGKNGKTTAAKICGIVGIVFAVIWFILGMMVGCASVFDAIDTTVPSSSSGVISSSGDSSSSSSSLTEDEAALEAAASARLDELKDKDGPFVQQLATELDASLADSTGYSLTDLGVDPASFAEWMLADFSYELDGAYAYDETGTVYADVTLRDAYEFSRAFYDEAQAAIDAGEIATSDEAAAMASIGQIFQHAMEASTDMTTSYVSIEFTKQDGSWVIDEDAWSDELDYLFGLY